jgi:prepilin-type N-terminal cleavage/methylation domain-containing protein
MRGHGYSLVEMMAVICIISILLAIVTLNFNAYAKRQAGETQTRTLYITLLNTQAKSVYQRRGTRIKLYARSFEVYSSLADGAAPLASQTLSYPITWNNKDSNNIDFDNKGIPKILRSICVDSSDDTGPVDSVVISTTRISVGKRDAGGICDADHITKK